MLIFRAVGLPNPTEQGGDVQGDDFDGDLTEKSIEKTDS